MVREGQDPMGPVGLLLSNLKHFVDIVASLQIPGKEYKILYICIHSTKGIEDPAFLKYPSTNLWLQDFVPLILSFLTLRTFLIITPIKIQQAPLSFVP